MLRPSSPRVKEPTVSCSCGGLCRAYRSCQLGSGMSNAAAMPSATASPDIVGTSRRPPPGRRARRGGPRPRGARPGRRWRPAGRARSAPRSRRGRSRPWCAGPASAPRSPAPSGRGTPRPRPAARPPPRGAPTAECAARSTSGGRPPTHVIAAGLDCGRRQRVRRRAEPEVGRVVPVLAVVARLVVAAAREVRDLVRGAARVGEDAVGELEERGLLALGHLGQLAAPGARRRSACARGW